MHDRKIFVKSPKQRPYIFPDEECLWRNGKVVQEIKKSVAGDTGIPQGEHPLAIFKPGVMIPMTHILGFKAPVLHTLLEHRKSLLL
jgi:hypothetical protein